MISRNLFLCSAFPVIFAFIAAAATAIFFDEHQKFMRFAEYDSDTNKTMHCMMAKQSKCVGNEWELEHRSKVSLHWELYMQNELKLRNKKMNRTQKKYYRTTGTQPICDSFESLHSASDLRKCQEAAARRKQKKF